MMTPIAASFIITIIEMALEHGVPAVISILNKWDVDDPTVADIETLRRQVKKPEEYFTKPVQGPSA